MEKRWIILCDVIWFHALFLLVRFRLFTAKDFTNDLIISLLVHPGSLSPPDIKSETINCIFFVQNYNDRVFFNFITFYSFDFLIQTKEKFNGSRGFVHFGDIFNISLIISERNNFQT